MNTITDILQSAFPSIWFLSTMMSGAILGIVQIIRQQIEVDRNFDKQLKK